MKSPTRLKTLAYITLAIVTMLFQAGAVSISGTVKDGNGNTIAGAKVRLGITGTTAVTIDDGSFTLTTTANSVLRPVNISRTDAVTPVTLQGNTFSITLTEQAPVRIASYDCKGRVVMSRYFTAPSGNSTTTLPKSANGILFHRITINRSEYLVIMIFGTTARSNEPRTRSIPLQCRAGEQPQPEDDVLIVTKNGYTLYRYPTTLAGGDVSGITATLLPLDTGTVTDNDGNSYRTIRYGDRTWTVENLRATKYNDGEPIPHVTDDSLWSVLTTPGYCFYEDATAASEQKKWGAMYNWYAVNTGKLAPAGWHVATEADWDSLQEYLIRQGYNFDGSPEGNRIAKSLCMITDWLPSIQTGSSGIDSIDNNSSGFSGLPNGYCDYYGATTYRNWYGFWWTTTEKDETSAVLRALSYYDVGLQANTFGKIYGLSVRIVKDE